MLSREERSQISVHSHHRLTLSSTWVLCKYIETLTLLTYDAYQTPNSTQKRPNVPAGEMSRLSLGSFTFSTLFLPAGDIFVLYVISPQTWVSGTNSKTKKERGESKKNKKKKATMVIILKRTWQTRHGKVENVAGLMQNAIICTNTTWPFLTLLQRDSFKTPASETHWVEQGGLFLVQTQESAQHVQWHAHGNRRFQTEVAEHTARTSSALFIRQEKKTEWWETCPCLFIPLLINLQPMNSAPRLVANPGQDAEPTSEHVRKPCHFS